VDFVASKHLLNSLVWVAVCNHQPAIKTLKSAKHFAAQTRRIGVRNARGSTALVAPNALLWNHQPAIKNLKSAKRFAAQTRRIGVRNARGSTALVAPNALVWVAVWNHQPAIKNLLKGALLKSAKSGVLTKKWRLLAINLGRANACGWGVATVAPNALMWVAVCNQQPAIKNLKAAKRFAV